VARGEMMKLQGMQPSDFIVDVPSVELGRQIGNSMSVNVLQRLFAPLLVAAGLLEEGSPGAADHWATGEAFERLVRPLKGPFANSPVVGCAGRHTVDSDTDVDISDGG